MGVEGEVWVPFSARFLSDMQMWENRGKVFSVMDTTEIHTVGQQGWQQGSPGELVLVLKIMPTL